MKNNLKTSRQSQPTMNLTRKLLPLMVAMSFNPVLAADLAANALPTGGAIVAGQGAIAQQNAMMNVTQNTQSMVVNWNSFNVGSQATVNFVQPSASAVVLNQVMSADPSRIQGQLNANGQVVIVNPSGVVFSGSARVDVGKKEVKKRAK